MKFVKAMKNRTFRRRWRGLSIGIVALVAFLLPALSAQAASIKNVQTGEVTFSGTTQNVTITSVDRTKSILFFSERSNTATPQQTSVAALLSSATNIAFSKNTGSGSVTVRWYVAEFDSGVTVQHGSSTVGSTTTNVAISSVNLSSSFVITNKLQSGTAFDETDFTRARLTSSTNLELATFAGSGGTAGWQVVTFDGADVSRNLLSMASGTATSTVTIPAVDLTRSFLLFSYHSATGTVANIGQKMIRGRFSSSTQLEFTRDNTGAAVSIAWEVIQLPVGNSVQSAISSFASATGQTDVTLSSVDLTRSVAFSANQAMHGNSWGRTSYSADDLPGRASFTHQLLNSTTLRLQRNSTGTAASTSYFVIDFRRADPNGPPVLAAIGPKSVNENVLLNFGTSATDPQGTTPTMSAVNLPSGATYTDNANGTGTFNWTPSFSQSGVYNVTFIASDGTLADSEVVAITVNNVNRAPVLAAIGAKSVNENVLLTFNDSATDPDGTTPTMSAVNVPSGATFTNNGNGTGTFTWTPNFTQSGVYNVTFIASDGTLADSEVVAITVNNVNRAPVLAAIGAKSTNEGVNLNFSDSATDPDGTTPTMTAVGLPSGATFTNNGNGTGTFNWTPNFAQSGVFNVTFIASDGTLADSEVVAITVNNINQAPVLAAIGPRSVNENVNLNFNDSATDPDGTVPTMSAINLPSGATFTNNLNGTGTFNWTPNFTQSGVYNVTFIASDGTLADSEVVAITVNNVNRAPVLATIGPRSVNENVNLNFNDTATDPDGTVPTMSAINLPSGATFTNNLNGTGTFNWTPNFTQSGVYNVTFIASDGTLADSEVVAITVNNVNRAPVLAAIGARNTNEGVNLSFNDSATDPDGTTPTMSAVGLPTGATFTNNANGTGTFSWTPTFFQSGSYNVTFIASDGTLADSEVVAITVNNVNRAPVLATIGSKSVNENVLLSFGDSATDPDSTIPTMSAINLPSGATFTNNGNGTGTFNWTPNFTQSGSYNVTFIASDGTLADSEVVAITVNNVNRAPVLAAIGAKSTNEGVNLNFNDTATDPDGTIPTMTAVGVPSGATFTNNGNGTGTFNWTPNFTQSGVFNVTFIASDGTLADSEVVAITVNNVNQAPVLATIGPKSVSENVNLNFNATATDVDLTTPTLSAVSLPSGATFVDNNNGTGTFNWTPNFTQSGNYNVTFIASDGTLADSEVVAITVNNTNRAPVLATIGPKSVSENANLNFNTSATDADGTIPTFTALNLPAGATYVDNTNGSATFNWTPSFSQSGNYNVTFITSDGTLADSEVVAITVNNVNRAPVLATIGSKNVSEGSNLNFNVTASDPDATIPTLTAISLPSGATFVDNTNGTGTFNWTPNFTQSGVYNVTFITSDGTLADSEVVTITVNNVNQAPVLATIGARNVNEGVNLNFDATATDVDGTIPTLSAVNLPSGATFEDNTDGTGTFDWTPNFTQSGVYNVTFIASDGTRADSEVVAITVNNVSLRPVLAAIGPKNVNEGVNLNFLATASDPDSTIPVLSAVGLPSGATFVNNANGTGTFNWTPSFSQSGNYNVTFIASDGALADSEVVVITVNNVNRAPVLAAIGPRNVNENSHLTFNISASDPDATTPSLNAINTPTNATFTDNGNGTGTFDFSPDFTQSGVYNVTFIATDGTLADSEVVAITVNNVNRAPVLATIGSKTVAEGAILNFNATASDADSTVPVLSAVNLPAGATFTNNLNGTGTFNFTPGFTQSGLYNITFIASDGTLADSEVVALTVTNTDRPPVLASIGSRNIVEGANLNFGINSNDPDGTTPVLSALNVPLNATFTDNGNGTGTFDFDPNFTQAGIYNVTFIATSNSLADSEVVAITVDEAGNQRPVLAGIGPKSVSENAHLAFSTSATDLDGTFPAMTAVGLPLNATYTDNGNGTASFDFDPDFTQSGVYNVTFIASDGSLADSEVVAITVNNVNRAPVLTAIGPKSVAENANLNFAVNGSDVDLEPLTLIAQNVPLNATFTDNGNGTGTFDFNPTFSQEGVYNVRFIVSDGLLADSEVVAITVSNVNRAPVLAAIGSKNVNEGANLNFSTSATDADSTALTLSAVSLPSGATFVAGTFNWTPSFSQSGIYNVTFIASDGSLADSEVVAITVNNVNQAPVLAAIGPKTIAEGAHLSFNISASDFDATIPTLTAQNVPTNATFTDNGNGTGTFVFDPDFTQSGVFNVRFIASDGTLADSELVAITVTNFNRTPVLASIGPRSVNENANLNFNISATDADGNLPSLSAVGLPLNATFTDHSDGTGTFDFNPSFTQSGVYNVTFIATDGSLADSEVVAVTVNNINRPPVLAAIGPKSVNEGANLNFAVSGSDPDLTTLTLIAQNVPTHATFTDNGNGTGSFVFNPDFTQSGVFNVRFIVSDGSLTDSEVVAITVNQVNLAPVLATIGPRSVTEGAVLNFNVSATDADATTPTLVAQNLPLNSTFSDNGNGTGTFNFSPTFVQSGVYNVRFIASDGTLADTEVVAITVNDAGNQRPVLASIGPRSVTEGQNLNFNVSGTDPDLTTPSFTVANAPMNSTFTDNGNGTATFNFSPSFAQAATYQVTFIASDGVLADSEVVTVTVIDGGNQRPVLASIGPKSVAEGAHLQFNLSATDPDETNPTFTAVGVPLNATLTNNGNGTATFVFDPSYTQAAAYIVTFIATDGVLADSEAVTITVTNTNRAPVLAAIGPKTVAEGATLNFNATATDPDLTIPTLSALTLPTHATFVDNGNGTGTFTFNPDYTQAGVYNVTIITSDGTLADSETFAITVTGTNLPPVLATIGPRSVTEGANLNFNVSATDPDATTPTLSAVSVPLNATFTDNGDGTGTLNFNPSYIQAGVFNVTFIASDGLLADSEVVAITVNEAGNQAPVLAAIGPKSVTEGVLLSFNISATDVDATIPSLLAQNMPTGATLTDHADGTATFSFTPDFTQAGVYNVRFIATDGSRADTEVVAVTVIDAGNQRPVLASIGARSVTEGSNLSFNASATDPDGTFPTMTAVGLPAGATYVNNGNGTGSFSFTPTFIQSGVYNVTFIASDGTLADSEVVAINVIDAGNQAPILASIGPRSVTEGASLSFNVTATDPDATTPTLLAQNLPTNATFTDNGNGSGSLGFNPNFTQAGVYNVRFIATDGTRADTEIVAVTVNEAGNQRPVLAAIGPKVVAEGATLNFAVTATDPDGTFPALTAVNLPLNSTFTDNGNGTASFSFSPDFLQGGIYNVRFIASDGLLADSELVSITVTAVNQAPVLAAIGPKSVNEGVLLNFGISANDPDGSTPQLTALNVPINATFTNNGNGTGTFTFTPNFTQAGVYNVTFIASDGSLADSEVVAITVNNINRAPVMAAIGAKSVNEGANLNFNITATDPDLTFPAFTALGTPLNATLVDNGNGSATFSFNPNFTQAGSFNVTFIASDGALADSEVVVITVNNVNQAPILASIGPRLVNEGANLNFNVSATDPDGPIPTLAASNVPLNATFIDNGNGTGTFNFNPTFTQGGVYNVRFVASDGTLADTEIVAITVNDAGNQRPVLASIGAKSVTEGGSLSFGTSATDADATTPTMSAINVPLNAAFVDNGNGTGTFVFNPTFTQAGVYNVTFVASDGALADSEVVAITVNEAGNQAPVLASIGPRLVTEGASLNFNVTATDVDATTPSLVAQNLPSNATFTDNGNGSGSFSFNPDFTQAGVYNVRFIASDGTLADTEIVAVTVNDAGNQRPVLAAIGPKSVNEGVNLNFNASATDLDATIPTLSAVGLPSGATFVNNGNGTGTFNWTPSFVQSGVHNVTFIASDGVLADSEVVAITVNNINRAPVLAAIGAKTVNEGVNLNFVATATDPDLTTPTLSAVGLPSGATFVDNNNGSGTFNWTPGFTQSGSYNVTFITSDGTLADSEVVAITVTEINRAPVLAAIGPKSVNENVNLNFNTSATDPDASVPTMIIVNLPSGATYTDHGNGTATFNWTPSYSQSGVYNVIFIASDGALADSEVVAITVNNVNLSPVLASIGPRSVNEGQNLNFAVSASDADATIPTLIAQNVPANATFTDHGDGTGTFNFNPTYLQDGVYNVRFIATAGTLADSEIVAITVLDQGGAVPPARITDLMAQISGNSIRLTWTPITTDSLNTPTLIDRYIVYRGTRAYFTPTVAESIGGVAAASGEFVDNDLGGADVVGDVNNNYFYAVTVIDQLGRHSNVSNRVGEYDYDMVTTAGTDFNLAGLPFANTGLATAQDVINSMGGTTNVNTLNNFVPSSQSYQARFAAGFGTNFAVTPGSVFQVNAKVNFVWSVAGRVPNAGSTTYPILTTATTDYSLVMIPFELETTLLFAQDVINSIPGLLNTFNEFLPASQSYRSRFAAGFGVNFPVKAGRVYQANAAANGAFPAP